MQHPELPIPEDIVVFKTEGFNVFRPRINRFATIVKIIHSLPEGTVFNSRQVANILGRKLFDNNETRYKECVGHHATAIRYLGKLSCQKFIERGVVQYATFSNGGKGYSSFYKRNPIPDLYIKQTLELK